MARPKQLISGLGAAQVAPASSSDLLSFDWWKQPVTVSRWVLYGTAGLAALLWLRGR